MVQWCNVLHENKWLKSYIIKPHDMLSYNIHECYLSETFREASSRFQKHQEPSSKHHKFASRGLYSI